DSTRARYEGVGRLYITQGRLAGMSIASIERDDVEDWITDLVEFEVGPPTIDKTYRTLRACFATAELEGKMPRNAASKIAVPEVINREPFFLDPEQVEAVANAV